MIRNQRISGAAKQAVMLFISIILLFPFAISTVGYAEVTLDGSLGESGPVGPGTLPDGTYTDYLIEDSFGKRAGSNLFHSFGEFSIETDTSATFTGPNSIENIISRVTGGTQSWIDGLLRSTIQDANLFLLNPSGVLFGPNATLDVNGSFHVSTADFLGFEDGETFYVNRAEEGVLSVASPATFGFLSENPAGISIQESTLQVPQGETLSVVGGDIEIVGPGITGPDVPLSLIAPSGRINLVSTASPSEVTSIVSGEPQNLQVVAESLGSIDITQGAEVSAAGDPGGTIVIRSGRFSLTESIVTAATRGSEDHPGVGIDMEVTEDLTLTAGEISSAEMSTSSFETGDAGNIRIVAGSLQMTGDPQSNTIADIASRVFGAGDGGDIDITTDTLQMNEHSGILAQVFGSGAGGDITLETDRLEVLGGDSLSFISTSTYDFGDAGNLDVNAESVLLRGGAGGFTGLATQVSSWAQGEANAGFLRLNTGSLEILDGAQINAAVFSGSGNAGNIEVVADTILIAGLDPNGYPAGIFSDISGDVSTGSAGNVLVQAGDLHLTDGGRIGTFSSSPGDSGNIEVETNSLTVTDGAFLSSVNFGTGKAGNIDVSADSILLSGPGPQDGFTGLSALGGVFATGAGDIEIRTSSLKVLEGAQISAQTTGPGAGGNIDVTADTVLIGGVDPGSGSLDGINAGIFTSTLVSEDFVDQATGRAGDIHIKAEDMEFRDHGTISALSTSAGDGGNITITASDMFRSEKGSVKTSAETALGGDIAIEARQVELTNNTVVSAESFGAGNAGDIYLTATDTFLMRESAVTTEAKQADGGNIKIDTEYMVHLVDSDITASVGGGPETVGGNISIDPEYVILNNSRIIANAYEGRGGNIEIVADVFLADPNSVVDASSELGIDGEVDIRAPITEVSGTLAPLGKDFQSAIALLREPCLARIQGGKYSSFIVGGRDSLPLEPGGLLPSPIR